MDIICECGHHADEHRGPFGCQVPDRLGNLCECEMSRADVAIVFALEQQARLDTNRAQVEALIAERDALKETLKKQQQILHNIEQGRHWIGTMKECRTCIDILNGDV